MNNSSYEGDNPYVLQYKFGAIIIATGTPASAAPHIQINCNYPRKCNLQHCCNGVTKKWCENNVKPVGAIFEDGKWVVKQTCKCDPPDTEETYTTTIGGRPTTARRPVITPSYTSYNIWMYEISERPSPYLGFEAKTCCQTLRVQKIRDGCCPTGERVVSISAEPATEISNNPISTLPTLPPFLLKDSAHLK